MKKLSLVILTLLTTSAFAASTVDLNKKFENTTLEDIYKKGYRVNATITTTPGIIIAPEETSSDLSSQCYLILQEKSEVGRILRTGRKIKFKIAKISDEVVDLRATDASVYSLVLRIPSTKSLKVKELADACNVKFNVEPNVEDDELQEI